MLLGVGRVFGLHGSPNNLDYYDDCYIYELNSLNEFNLFDSSLVRIVHIDSVFD